MSGWMRFHLRAIAAQELAAKNIIPADEVNQQYSRPIAPPAKTGAEILRSQAPQQPNRPSTGRGRAPTAHRVPIELEPEDGEREF